MPFLWNARVSDTERCEFAPALSDMRHLNVDLVYNMKKWSGVGWGRKENREENPVYCSSGLLLFSAYCSVYNFRLPSLQFVFMHVCVHVRTHIHIPALQWKARFKYFQTDCIRHLHSTDSFRAKTSEQKYSR